MKLSIIIVSYRVKQLLLNCIGSIYTCIRDIPFEIVVVDNHSEDGTAEAIKESYPEVILIENDSNRAFSAGNNQGIKHASGEYILLLNPDTLFTDESFRELFSFSETLQKNFILAPKLLNKDGSLQTSAWKDKSLMVLACELIRIFPGTYPLEHVTSPEPVENVAGAVMLFRRKMTEQTGVLDENLFWMEDLDFCYRIRKAGGEVIYFPGASLIHYGGASKEKNLPVAYANATVSKLKFYRKHHTYLSFTLAGVILGVQTFSRLVLFLLLSPFHRRSRTKAGAYAYALKKYFRYIFLGDGRLM